MEIGAIQNERIYPLSKAESKADSEPISAEDISNGQRKRDTYIPSEEDKPIGLYALSHDDEGNPRVEYDEPVRTESCTGNTDKVDMEIKRLREQKKLLEQRIRSAAENERAALEKQLRDVENELTLKDNDEYRKRNTVFT